MAKYRLDINLSDNTTNPVEFTVPTARGNYQLDLPLSNGTKITAGAITVDSNINTYRLTLKLSNGQSIDCGTFSTEAIRAIMAYLLAGNFKMNQTKADISGYLDAMQSIGFIPSKTETIICPQTCLIAPYKDAITKAGSALSFLKLGAQLCSPATRGAYTGQNSVEALASVGAEYVIVGHSEVRVLFGDMTSNYAEQMQQAISKGCKVLFCVGETLEERNAGLSQQIISQQLTEGLMKENAGISAADIEQYVSIVYEPVWAIGTGVTATERQVQEVLQYIQGWLVEHYSQTTMERVKLLYGGSVNMNNYVAIISLPECDGFLAGGISLKPIDFIEIAKGMDNN